MLATKAKGQLLDASKAVLDAMSGLDSVRVAFNETGKSFSGPVNITQDKKDAVASFLDQDHVAKRLIDCSDRKGKGTVLTKDQARDFLMRYEEFLRRTNAEVSPVNKVFAYRILLSRLIQLAHAIEITPSKIYGAVIRNDNLHHIPKDHEFKCFSTSLGTFRHAVVHNPNDPRAFLKKLIDTSERIFAEPDFAVLSDTPGVVRYAVLYHPKDPEEFLRMFIKKVNSILTSPKFACFSDLPADVKRAVLTHIKDPERFLSSAIEEIKAVSKEEEFECFANHAWIIKYAALNNTDQVRGFLRSIISDTQKILEDREFQPYKNNPASIYRALVFNADVEAAKQCLRKRAPKKLSQQGEPGI